MPTTLLPPRASRRSPDDYLSGTLPRSFENPYDARFESDFRATVCSYGQTRIGRLSSITCHSAAISRTELTTSSEAPVSPLDPSEVDEGVEIPPKRREPLPLATAAGGEFKRVTKTCYLTSRVMGYVLKQVPNDCRLLLTLTIAQDDDKFLEAQAEVLARSKHRFLQEFRAWNVANYSEKPWIRREHIDCEWGCYEHHDKTRGQHYHSINILSQPRVYDFEGFVRMWNKRWDAIVMSEAKKFPEFHQWLSAKPKRCNVNCRKGMDNPVGYLISYCKKKEPIKKGAKLPRQWWSCSDALRAVKHSMEFVYSGTIPGGDLTFLARRIETRFPGISIRRSVIEDGRIMGLTIEHDPSMTWQMREAIESIAKGTLFFHETSSPNICE